MELSVQRQLRYAVHPHKFMLWLGMASIVMFFAGFTSAYIVKHGDTNVWKSVPLPSLFWLSTTLILISSITMSLSVRAFKKNNVRAYRGLLWTTFGLGIGFLISQILAWKEMISNGLSISTEVASDYLYVIGGVIALAIIAVLALTKYRSPEDTLMQNINPDKIPAVELAAIYWHFVDLLWLYLFIFFIVNT
jgi:cytochrome c oxidase subunit 3